MLNSATIAPLRAACGANIAAGYTTEDVPTTRHTSQLDIASSVKDQHEHQFIEFSMGLLTI